MSKNKPDQPHKRHAPAEPQCTARFIHEWGVANKVFITEGLAEDLARTLILKSRSLRSITAAYDMFDALEFYATAWRSTSKELISSGFYNGTGHDALVGLKVTTLPSDDLMRDCGNKARLALEKARIPS